MRRAFLILLFGLCLFPVLAPLLALAGGVSDAPGALPACCRRSGAHQCAMFPSERAQRNSGERIAARPAEPCPFRAAVFAPAPNPTLTPTPSDASGPIAAAPSHARGPAQAEVSRRFARERARHKRGPPASLLS